MKALCVIEKSLDESIKQSYFVYALHRIIIRGKSAERSGAAPGYR